MKLIYGQQRFKSKEIPQICGFMWYMLGEEMNTSHIRGNTPPPHRGNDPLEFNMAEGFMKLIYGQQRFKSKEIPQICGFMWYIRGEEMNPSHIRGNDPSSTHQRK